MFLGSALLAMALLVPAAPYARTLIPGVYAPRHAAERQNVASTKQYVFAVIGDYGTGGDPARHVASLVSSWRPAFVVTTGDDYYSVAGGSGAGRYDNSTARFYASWMAGVSTGAGRASRNAFFPSLGNHDYTDALPGPGTYLGYFDLPGRGFTNSSGNERYYDFLQGNAHFFVLNSSSREPDGMTATSKQATWLRDQLALSTSRWNIVVDHNPPYSSDDVHGSDSRMQWPYAAWGADVVLSGHAHTYERVSRDGMVYFVNGLGGAGRYGVRKPVVPGSQRFYSSDWGAQKVTVRDDGIRFDFYDTSGRIIDRYLLAAD